jgi:gas vesicle protein
MRFFLGFVFGLLIGASIALALAPQPGIETRAKIVEQVRARRRANQEPAEASEAA